MHSLSSQVSLGTCRQWGLTPILGVGQMSRAPREPVLGLCLWMVSRQLK